MKKHLIDIFTPNKYPHKHTITIMVVIQIAIFLLFWMFNSYQFIPKPTEIISAYPKLIHLGIVKAVISSTFLCLEAMFFTIIISLLFSYLAVLPFFRPFAFIFTKARFLTLVGLSFIFLMIASDGHALKVSLLVFGMSVFFVTSMNDIINQIDKSEFNHARTLRMSEWQVVWEIVILSRIDKVFEVVRQNFAIAWMMLTMVEGLVRSEGGIGVLLLNENKYLRLDIVFAIQSIVLIIGIALDYFLGYLKVLVCPYSILTLEKK